MQPSYEYELCSHFLLHNVPERSDLATLFFHCSWGDFISILHLLSTKLNTFFNQCEIKRLAKKRSSLKHDKLHKFFIQCELFCIQFELHQAPYTISSMRKAFSKFLWQNKASRTTIRCVIELTELIAASSSKFMRASRYVQNWRHSNK